MNFTAALSVTALALAVSTSVDAQAPMNPMEHTNHLAHQPPTAAPGGGDGRQLVNFPPEMRQHTLANMRDHLLALSEILAAMAAGQYTKASQVAGARLGMDSPSAEGCRDDKAAAKPQMSKAPGMDHQMGDFMPEGMRKLGLDMHQAASAFAGEAAKAARTGNAKPALAALSRVTQQCTSCHSTYKVQ